MGGVGETPRHLVIRSVRSEVFLLLFLLLLLSSKGDTQERKTRERGVGRRDLFPPSAVGKNSRFFLVIARNHC